jgi:hypothetical protein
VRIIAVDLAALPPATPDPEPDFSAWQRPSLGEQE